MVHRETVAPGLDRAVAAVVLVVALGLYSQTASVTITWRHGGSDSGELVTASYTLGIAHPPGYPLYILLARAWSMLPLGETAHRYSLFSALCGGATAALVALLVMRIGRRLLVVSRADGLDGAPAVLALAGAASGLALVAAPAFWSQATIPEVYTLNALVLVAALWLLVLWSDQQDSRTSLILLALASLTVGLGMGNHLTTVFLVPAGAAYVAPLLRSPLRPSALSSVVVAGLALLVGLAVYIYLPIRAAQGPTINWGDPSTLDRFWRHVSAADYQGYFLGRSMPEVLLRVPVASRLLVEQFTWIGAALLLLGVAIAWSVRDGRREAALLLAVALANTVFALLYNAEGSQVYLLPAFVIGSVFLGLGAGWAVMTVGVLAGPGAARLRWMAAVGLLVLLVPVVRGATAYPEVDVSGDREALNYALEALNSAPAGAALYTRRDEETFALWYAQQVLGVRPDVVVVDVRLLPFPWYQDSLRRQYSGTRDLAQTR